MKPAYQTPRQDHSTLQKKAFKNAQRRAAGATGVGSSHVKATHGPIPTLELFQKENSLLSHFVRNKMSTLGLDFIAHSVPDDQPLKHELLVRAGGKDRIPFLIDHSTGVKLYGLQAISAYLEKSYGSPLTRSRMDVLLERATQTGTLAFDKAKTLVESVISRAQGARA